MGIGREGLQVTGDAVVSRIGEDDGLGLGMGGDSPLQTVQVRTQRYLTGRIEAAFHIDRNGAAQDQAVDDALVGFAGDDELIAIAADSQDHGFNAGRRAVDGKESPPGAIEVGGQFHGFLQRPFRLEQVIQSIHDAQVPPQGVAKEIGLVGRNALSQFMTRCMVGLHVLLAIPFQGFDERRLLLLFSIHGPPHIAERKPRSKAWLFS